MNHLSDNQISVYEEPVHERIRKLIKLEFLFNQIHYFKNKEEAKLRILPKTEDLVKFIKLYNYYC